MRIVLILLSLLCLLACGSSRLSTDHSTWAQPVTEFGVPLLHKVTPLLYRCVVPSSADLITVQKELTIRTVISIRAYHNARDEASGLPLNVHRIKMNPGHVDPVALKNVLNIIKTAPKPILIYNADGTDRTGLVIAAYRIAAQNWSHDDAIDELENGIYGYREGVFPGLITWIRSDGVTRISY